MTIYQLIVLYYHQSLTLVVNSKQHHPTPEYIKLHTPLQDHMNITLLGHINSHMMTPYLCD